ncbi:hypothetical protein [Hymenobacter algoricola]|uniref:hypothetical protein n=1 Tax=Hymenobacter algoricola TaxID=486267 RepID=UPI0031E4F8CE
MSLLLTGCSLLGSSEKCNPDFNKVYYSAGINFELLDAHTSKNLLDVRTGIYSPDAVKVYDATRQVVFPGPVRGDGLVSFSPLERESDRLPYGTDLQREYYLYLNPTDQDTFALAFRLRKNECGFAEFERYTLRYNGKEVAVGEGLTIPSLTLYKR